MTRKAIIIGNNTGKDAPLFLKGVDKDLANYKQYLSSGGGGSWVDYSEITIVHNSKRSDILKTIGDSRSDYSFVVFTGHGFINSKDGLTYICVDDGFISEDELKTKSVKQLLILDCCREKHIVTESRTFSGAEVKSLMKSLESDIGGKSGSIRGIDIETKLRADFQERLISNARGKFDNALVSCSLGIFTGYACEVDQTSGDNPLAGGVFSTTLMRTGKEFSKVNNSDYWMPIRKAINETRNALQGDAFTQQRPTYKTNPSDMSITPPFAVTNTPNE